MKISKYINVDDNILIEYIYDDSNLIGEAYNILYNTQTGIKCFVSSEEPRPAPRGFKRTNNDLYNQLYLINYVQNKYAKVPLTSLPDKIDTTLAPFLQLRNFATSIPIRYDTIKVHVPVDYVFEDHKGFYLRVYTYDYNNKTEVELSNFHFNITDILQNYKLEYSSPILYLNSKQWGKYVEIKVPAVTKVSDQRIRNIPRANSINFNLSPAGVGLSKTAPVSMDFHFINRITSVNGNYFYDLSPKKTVVVPQTPEFEKLGVKIEESTQGDFFLVYGTYNGTLGDFETFIEDQYYEGNRYYVQFIMEIFERNVKTKTTSFIVKENFGEEVEYRPILKFSSTTAVIDVTMRLINSVDSTTIERKASYGLLQGGGAKMGSEPNTRLNTANGSGGAGDISKYARYLRKMNLLKATKQGVFYIKSSKVANAESNSNNVKSIINFRKIPFVLFSMNYYLLANDVNFTNNNINHLANLKSIVYITPYDNFVKVRVIGTDYIEEISLQLETYTNIKMSIKSDQKTLTFDLYKDSPDNVFSEGRLVFKVPQDKYSEIKTLYNSGFNTFYINGTDSSGVKRAIYTSFYIPWDTPANLNKLASEYELQQINAQALNQSTLIPPDPTTAVNAAIDEGTNVPTTTNTDPAVQAPVQPEVSMMFNPRWENDLKSLEVAIGNRNNWTLPLRRDFLITISEIPQLGITPESKSKQFEAIENKDSMVESIQSINDRKIDLIFGYFKGLDLNPKDFVSYWFLDQQAFGTNLPKTASPLQKDLLNYINTGLSQQPNEMGMGLPEKEVVVGEFLPTPQQYKQLVAAKIAEDKAFNMDKVLNGQVARPTKSITNQDKSQIFYSPEQLLKPATPKSPTNVEGNAGRLGTNVQGSAGRRSPNIEGSEGRSS
jgi:hypothetical protein